MISSPVLWHIMNLNFFNFFCSEYGIYNTKFRDGTSGLPVCDILRNKHVIRKITALGDSNRVFILYSPGITLDPRSVR